ncbi:MAG: DNA sulfur modification protein DndB [Solibacillus sp.]
MTHELRVYSIAQLIDMYDKQLLVLRSTEMRHVRKIRSYIIEQFGAGNVFFPPIVASENDGILYVIDGSSRLKAAFEIPALIEKMELSMDHKELEVGIQLRLSLQNVRLGFQVHHNLDERTCDQLFIDHNTKGKKVALSKRIAYDSRNAINVVTNEILQQHTALLLAGVEQEKVSLNRPKNKKFVSLSQLRTIVALFVTGKENVNMTQANEIDQASLDVRFPLIMAWLDEVFSLEPPQNIGDYQMSILANFTVVRSLAYYALVGEKDVPKEQKEYYIRQRMQALKHISWESRQVLWEQFNGTYRGKHQLYFINKDKQTLDQIIDWLVAEGGGTYVKA